MSDEPTVQRKNVAPLLFGALLGLAVTVGFLVVIGVILTRQTLPQLTEPAYEAALARWQAAGLQDYDCEIEVTGNRPGKILVETRHGIVTQMIRDGQVPRDERTWQYWSVDGQFEMIAEELDLATNPTPAMAGGQPARVFLSAEFDEKLGYPHVFRRIVSGANQDMGWRITRFEAKK